MKIFLFGGAESGQDRVELKKIGKEMVDLRIDGFSLRNYKILQESIKSASDSKKTFNSGSEVIKSILNL